MKFFLAVLVRFSTSQSQSQASCPKVLISQKIEGGRLTLLLRISSSFFSCVIRHLANCYNYTLFTALLYLYGTYLELTFKYKLCNSVDFV